MNINQLPKVCIALLAVAAVFTGIESVSAAGFSGSRDVIDQHPQVKPGRKYTPELSFPANSPLHQVLTENDWGEIDNDLNALTSESVADDSMADTKIANDGYNYLEGPDGSTWYYTASYEMEDVYYNEYYTDHILQSFTFNIYNQSRRLVGTVHDKIRYASNEVRDRECVLDPKVSLNFFNTDDKPEVMVYHAMNTLSYVNHYYYSVYSVGGEKDSEGYDKPLMNIEGRCVDVTHNNSTTSGENLYYTFVIDPVIDFPLYDPDYVAKLNQTFYNVVTYSKAESDTSGPRVYMTKKIYSTCIPGDTTEGIYFMTKRYENRLFFIYSQYEKPYFVDPRGSAEDESATPDNSLVIDVFDVTGNDPQFISTTTIPVNAVPSTTHLTYTFLSIGSVAWSQDVDMKFNGTPDAPAFIVAKDVALASDIDNMRSSYYVYGNDGTLLKTIAENTERMFLYQNGDLQGPLTMFVSYDDDGNYIFIFAYLYSGDQLAVINQNNNGDPLYASCVPMKVDGEYKFVFEMKVYAFDSHGNTYARVAWFGKGGELERVDKINLGTDVQASMVYMDKTVLNPKLFDTDDAMEYAVLVRRTHGATSRNEYLIVDDNGGWYATYTSDDGYGEPNNLYVMTGYPNRLVIQYISGSRTNTRTVTLPFTTPSTGAPEPDEEEEEDVTAIEEILGDAQETTPVYYDLNGRRVAAPSHGIYIRRSGNATTKVYVK